MCKPGKHRFYPRYDRKWSTPMNDIVSSNKNVTKVHGKANDSYLKEETYVFDICVRCGQTISRGGPC